MRLVVAGVLVIVVANEEARDPLESADALVELMHGEHSKGHGTLFAARASFYLATRALLVTHSFLALCQQAQAHLHCAAATCLKSPRLPRLWRN